MIEGQLVLHLHHTNLAPAVEVYLFHPLARAPGIVVHHTISRSILNLSGTR